MPTTALIMPCTLKTGAWGSVVVKALRYKSEGPGIDSGVFSVASDSSMCTRLILGVKAAGA
jgi:hypothetical protein